eukprot:6180234-Pleurochrysis_carterae.AAC.1
MFQAQKRRYHCHCFLFYVSLATLLGSAIAAPMICPNMSLSLSLRMAAPKHGSFVLLCRRTSCLHADVHDQSHTREGKRCSTWHFAQ